MVNKKISRLIIRKSNLNLKLLSQDDPELNLVLPTRNNSISGSTEYNFKQHTRIVRQQGFQEQEEHSSLRGQIMTPYVFYCYTLQKCIMDFKLNHFELSFSETVTKLVLL